MNEPSDKIVAQSPEYVRMSLAAAMTLGFKRGLFYRNAKLHCINLLLTYPQACIGKCAYCGLSGTRSGEYSQRAYSGPVAHLLARRDYRQDIGGAGEGEEDLHLHDHPKTGGGGHEKICRRLRSSFDVPVSLFICPTLLGREDLVDFKEAGADKIGVAIDLERPISSIVSGAAA